ncbi:hypothetical protein [Tenacibaculum singaporense]|uniref:Uncharacterized protein n=1 Tax=Tenacibaculum singaporense TaxID=2358479 RepID=A0A3Q8RSK1_9FLAO|nr:hypothetical protein [Tenacibaculum singaporense]AZJ36354.1 hypothetical protein D6T69_12785 [Tenacibaculum singaporense]
MSNTIKLNFINRSNDANNSDVVIFQKNVASNFDEHHIAWKVIKNPSHKESHPIHYSTNFQVAASDSYGNFTPHLSAYDGSSFEMVEKASGYTLQPSQYFATNIDEVEIQNNLELGSININCYKDGKLLATKRNIAPGQKAVFKFNPKIYIGVTSGIEEGQILNPAIISKINTEINLFEVQSADIVMTGGGSEPFNFSLENVTYIPVELE